MKKKKSSTSRKKSAAKKKDTQLLVRIDTETRERFIQVCEELDTSASREVRRFIKRFLIRFDNGELDD